MVKVKTPPKELRIASTSGHVVKLPAETTVEIPEAIVSEACARGCVVVGDYDPDPEAREPVYGKEAADRKALNEIRILIEHMIEDSKPNEWTNEGKPDAKALTRRRSGQRVTKAMRDKVWDEHFADERSRATG